MHEGYNMNETGKIQKATEVEAFADQMKDCQHFLILVSMVFEQYPVPRIPRVLKPIPRIVGMESNLYAGHRRLVRIRGLQRSSMLFMPTSRYR